MNARDTKLAWATLAAAALLMPPGCDDAAPTPAPGAGAPRMETLPIQQSRAYPETVTGAFVSLIDFENVPGGQPGHRQAARFRIQPDDGAGERSFVVNVTRTGVGALRVKLPQDSRLVLDLEDYHDFGGYTLLSLAVYAERPRDDLVVTLATDAVRWRSPRTLLQPGWNTVLIDIRRLGERGRFDPAGVRRFELGFADAVSPVDFVLDDVLLVDNTREIRPTPPGMTVRKSGLDYEIRLPHRDRPLRLMQDDDGLWRLEPHQAVLQVAAPDEPLAVDGVYIDRLGWRKIGRVELLEANRLRVRLANTWYFPTRSGEWARETMRHVRWEHTFYGDGRWVTHCTLNNSGGRAIGKVRMSVMPTAAWASGVVSEDLVVRDFLGPIGRWSFLRVPESRDEDDLLRENYMRPGRLEVAVGTIPRTAGDARRDGFDESQGCWRVRARDGRCRFTLIPPPQGLLDPVIRVGGDGSGAVSISSQGLAIRDAVRESDAVLFRLPGKVSAPRQVEVVRESREIADRRDPRRARNVTTVDGPADRIASLRRGPARE